VTLSRCAVCAQEQIPQLACDFEGLTAAIEACLVRVTVRAAPQEVSVVQQPLLFALGQLADANMEADLALQAARADGLAALPACWERDLWTHAFSATAWSGSVSALLEAKESYRGAPIEHDRLRLFLAEKQHDRGLGAGERIDALEWCAMAALHEDADALMKTLRKPGGSGMCALEQHLTMDRFILAQQSAATSDPSFKVFIKMQSAADSQRWTTAYLDEKVQLEVWATQSCYFYLIEQDCTGDLCYLIPNPDQPKANNYLTAGQHRLVPSVAAGDTFGLEFRAPVGLERVIVFATKEPWAEFAKLAKIEDAYVRAMALTKGMGTTRGIGRVPLAAAPTVMAVTELTFTLLAR
jgi:hypothetical protein